MNASRRDKRILAWKNFFRDCLVKSLDFKHFETTVRKQNLKANLDGVGVITAWAHAHDGATNVRPRQMVYFEQMLQSRIFSDADALFFVLNSFKNTIANQDEYLIKVGAAKGEWKQTLEGAILERLAYQMVNFRSATVAEGDRLPDMRAFKPLMALLFSFVELLEASVPLHGPAMEIANELGKFVAAYINDLSLLGLLSGNESKSAESIAPLIPVPILSNILQC